MLDQYRTVASVVLDHSECAEVFQRHRIDFCCHGDVSVEKAAKQRGIAADVLMGELSQAISARHGERPADPRELTTPALIAHIVSTHHAYLRKALPFIHMLATKVGRVHGEHNPKLPALAEAVSELATTLISHIEEEEEVLFPVLNARQMNRGEATLLLGEMIEEHLEVAKLLERIRAASDDFSLPNWACNSYRTLFAELRELEVDIFTHIHLENHVLKPRFTEGATHAEQHANGVGEPKLVDSV
jgi:regulator of cell morphogenesis and NO signaling